MTSSDPVLAVLLRHHLVDDDTPGTRAVALRVAAVVAHPMADVDLPTAVAEHLDWEALGTARSEVVQEAAREVVEVLRGKG